MTEGFTCAVDERYRSACKDLPKYSGSRFCVLHEPNEAKDQEEFQKVKKRKLDQKNYDFRGTVFPEGTSDFEGFKFDANTNFDGATFIGEANFSRAKFGGERTNFREAQFSGEKTDFTEAEFSSEKGTNFRETQFSSEKGTLFREAQFSGGWRYFTEVQFGGERTDFSGAQFSDGWTSFMRAQFSGERTDFTRAQFSGKGAGFMWAQFSAEETNFSSARFSGKKTDFSEARFSTAYTSFESVTFTKEVRFSLATFREKVEFWGTSENLVFDPRAWVWFDTHIANPELLTFHTVLLHPSWFINVDVRKVDFTDVKWAGIFDKPEDFKHAIQKHKGRVKDATEALKKRELAQAWRKLTANALDNEIEALKTRGNTASPHTLLAQACRRLSANAEEKHQYPLSNEFQYWSMDALRKESWRSLRLIGTLYWALSGYGVRAARAFLVLLGMWAVFVCLYLVTGSIEHVGQALLYSLAAMVRLTGIPAMAQLTKHLQPSEPGLFQLLVIAEGILGPLQIALLALAIRRQVMR